MSKKDSVLLKVVDCWICDGKGCSACDNGRIIVRVVRESRRRAHGSIQSKPTVRGTRIGSGCYKRGGMGGAE